MILKLNAQLFWAKLQFCSLFPFWARETLTGMIEEKKAKEKHIYMGGNYPRNTGQKGIDKKNDMLVTVWDFIWTRFLMWM